MMKARMKANKLNQSFAPGLIMKPALEADVEDVTVELELVSLDDVAEADAAASEESPVAAIVAALSALTLPRY